MERYALVLGATLRLTRLVVVDDIGQWWVKDPIDNAAARWWHRKQSRITSKRNTLRQLGVAESKIVELVPEFEQPWWWKYRSGLDCPFCVGFWIGAGVLASGLAFGHTRSWRFVAAALTLNEVSGHLGARLGDVMQEED